MKKYVVIFEEVWENHCGTEAKWIPSKQRFYNLKDAREYARNWTNSSIYRIEWTENGVQFVKKLKTI